MPGITLRATLEEWPLKRPFSITGYRWESLPTVLVTLQSAGHIGRGEAAGVYYRNDTPELMLRQIESLRPTVESGVTRLQLQRLLPRGGARNALDSALWDLEAKIKGVPAWADAELEKPRPLLTTFTCGVDDPERMASTAGQYTGARAIKIKLRGDTQDADRVRAIRTARRDVWLGVDANQGFTLPFLERLMPVLVEAQVSLIEQPFPIGEESRLDGFRSPIPIAADESVQGLEDVQAASGRFQVINIKLDKCGGLTEGLLMARRAQSLGMDVMVGNMMGTSLALAPAFLLGQLCKVVDLDGAIFLKGDRTESVRYQDGLITSPPELWGAPVEGHTV